MITLSFNDIVKSGSSREYFTSQICFLRLFVKVRCQIYSKSTKQFCKNWKINSLYRVKKISTNQKRELGQGAVDIKVYANFRKNYQ